MYCWTFFAWKFIWTYAYSPFIFKIIETLDDGVIQICDYNNNNKSSLQQKYNNENKKNKKFEADIVMKFSDSSELWCVLKPLYIYSVRVLQITALCTKNLF